MALKIRLRQQGRNNRPFYRLVVTDVRSPRDGKYVEAIGWYNPFEAALDKSISVKAERIQHWLEQGAQFTEGAQHIVARVAPEVVQAHGKRLLARRAKVAVKRKARRQAKVEG